MNWLHWKLADLQEIQLAVLEVRSRKRGCKFPSGLETSTTSHRLAFALSQLMYGLNKLNWLASM